MKNKLKFLYVVLFALTTFFVFEYRVYASRLTCQYDLHWVDSSYSGNEHKKIKFILFEEKHTGYSKPVASVNFFYIADSGEEKSISLSPAHGDYENLFAEFMEEWEENTNIKCPLWLYLVYPSETSSVVVNHAPEEPHASYKLHSEKAESSTPTEYLSCGEYNICYKNINNLEKTSASWKIVNTKPNGIEGYVEVSGKKISANGTCAAYGGKYGTKYEWYFNSCPKYMYYSGKDTNRYVPGDDIDKLVDISYQKEYYSSIICTNSSDNEALIIKYKEDLQASKGSGGSNVPAGPPMTCQSLRGTDTYKIIKEIFKWIQIAAPIMLIIFGVIDFSKAVASGDNDAIKKAQSTFVKRVIIVAIIILLPTIMELLFSLLDGALGNDISTCEINK